VAAKGSPLDVKRKKQSVTYKTGIDKRRIASKEGEKTTGKKGGEKETAHLYRAGLLGMTKGSGSSVSSGARTSWHPICEEMSLDVR